MAKTKIAILEGSKKRAALLKALFRATQYEALISGSARQLMDSIGEGTEPQLILTNTTISRDDQDGVRFIKALYLKQQRAERPMPSIIVCSAEDRGSIVRQYAYRFSELAQVYYVFMRDSDIEHESQRLLYTLQKALEGQDTSSAAGEAKGDKHTVHKNRLKDFIKQTTHLPTMPTSAAQAQKALDDPQVPLEELGKIIQQDMTLAANAIKLANSPDYGASGRVTSLEEAYQQIGRKTVIDTLLATQVFDALEILPSDFNMESLRKHSYAVAIIARVMARRCHTIENMQDRINFSSTMFTAGLLHDIGKVLIAQHFPKEIDDIMPRTYSGEYSMVEAEAEVFGFDHADAGLQASMEWQLPILLINVIGRHHWPLEKILPRLKTKQGHLSQRIIRVADATSYQLGYGMIRSDGKPPEMQDTYFEGTGITRSEFEKWVPEIHNDIAYMLETAQ